MLSYINRIKENDFPTCCNNNATLFQAATDAHASVAFIIRPWTVSTQTCFENDIYNDVLCYFSVLMFLSVLPIVWSVVNIELISSVNVSY
jgi:hypothetical protein